MNLNILVIILSYISASSQIVSKLKLNIHSFHLNFENSDLFKSELSFSISGNIAILHDKLELKDDMIIIVDDNYVYKANIQRIVKVGGIIVPTTFQFNPPNAIKYFTASPTIVEKIKYYASTLGSEVVINLSIEAFKPIKEEVYLLVCVITSFSISFLSFWLFSGIFTCVTERNKLPLHHIMSKLPQFICLLSFINYYRISFNLVPLKTIAIYTYMLLVCFYKAFFFGIIASIAHGWQIIYFSEPKLNLKLSIALFFSIDYIIEIIVWTTTDYPITDIGYFTIIGKNTMQYSLLMIFVLFYTVKIKKRLEKFIAFELSQSSMIVPSFLIKKKYTM